jgi:drug/metabolite transporter (DMT)-like permease
LLVFLALLTGMYGLKLTDPFISNLVSLSSSIFTIILAVFLLKEPFRWWHIISLLMVISGTWLLS